MEADFKTHKRHSKYQTVNDDSGNLVYG